MLDTSCTGSFIKKTIKLKWDLLETIKCNYEDWELDEGKNSCINLKFDYVSSLGIPMLFVNLALNMDLTMRY